ncbi:MAG TPA: hypothetical protein VEC36_01270 [Patescibacteria group bacterium]|nr:hypothetical protein [Patescibacteria group bacterium]
METKVFKANFTGYLATSGFFILSVFVFIASLVHFLIKLDVLSASIWFAGIMFLVLAIYGAISNLNDVHITETEIIIFHKISKKVTKIVRDSIHEIDFQNESSDGPYIDFWYSNSGSGKKIRKRINLTYISPQKKFLLALSELATIHTYNGIKSDFKDIAKGW